MIRFKFVRSGKANVGFECSGHAGYAEAGQDIVCAAVSSAVQLTANLITETFGIEAQVSAKGDTVNIRTDGSEIPAKLLEALSVHLQCISEEFPGTIKLEFTEV